MKQKIKLKDAYIIALKDKTEIFVKDKVLYQCGWMVIDELTRAKGWEPRGQAGGCWAIFERLVPTGRGAWADTIGNWLTDLGFDWSAEIRDGGSVGFNLISIKRRV